MKTSAFLTALCAALASAGIVVVPIHSNQIVPKVPGDCFFGEATPYGCGPLRSA
ncbi:hypothetical protein GGS23DRAFT_184678 [Durotheca rogersii]|uniref:uncharacterized protein n=1 Tax=Durotheca rogersii TaxID=419775 RepID=UPI0022208B4C|nr:uncharacterized protein GGS23DRAFT_184678 [Durotheca rogersii]KAI5867588.1 hypothetical protein GGS23DRAFT_184678 [Durotheca rogersii]